MTDAAATIFLVDDDEAVLRALGRLLATAGYEVRSYTSPVRFLAEHDPAAPGCAVLDLSMPDIDGLSIQAVLSKGSAMRPVIFLTGAGDIPTSVRAMKAGAVDFLTKPIQAGDLLAAVARAVALDRDGRRARSDIAEVAARLDTLTPREREVLALVVAGRLNKQIAHELGTSIKTIKVHRARVMAKMGVRTVADLVRATELTAGAGPAVREGHGT
jgi:FixJ family two-component response regulator